MTGSGAMKNIALDFADDLGLALPTLSAPVVDKLTAMLPAYAVTCGIPLVEMNEDHSTTCIRPGSHRWRQDDQEGPLLTPRIPVLSAALCLPAGFVLSLLTPLAIKLGL